MNDFIKYQLDAQRTLNSSLNTSELTSMLAMGLAGETGELVDEIKKIQFHAKPMSEAKLREEIGDILWYLTMLCGVFNFSLDLVAGENIEKLTKRHGDSFKKHNEQIRE